MKIFGRDKTNQAVTGEKGNPSTAPAAQTVRPAAQLREDLQTDMDSAEQIAARIESTQADLTVAQQLLDSEMQQYVLGSRRSEPSREELAATVSKLDALRRIHATTIGRIGRLQSSLVDAELTEAIKAGKEVIPPLITAAEFKLDEFKKTLEHARNLESELLELLFNKNSGLLQNFATRELETEAVKARMRLGNRTIEIAERGSYIPSPRFGASSGQNFGPEKVYIRSA